MTPAEILKRYFGYDEFREGQLKSIDALTNKRDVLGVMPTGAGKSICYQVPAMLLSGVTLVISPLISLMRDQVQALTATGIPAAFINSSLSESHWSRVMKNAESGLYKIIYIAPERLLARSMLDLSRSLQISMIAVDEAHCISQWGQDFRPSYLDIPKFVDFLPTRPVLAAFTATATPRVRDDITRILNLINPLTLVTGFDRPNLYFEVKQPKDKYAALTQYLRQNDGNGIVYCSTRKEVETVTEKLITDGYTAAIYHAGLPDDVRSRSQDDFLYDRIRIIVATNAFGMGIDKPNVRFVIHYNMPRSPENYYQEAGRAGRDGLPADCILFYSRKDISTAVFLINQSENQDEIANNRKLLDQMEQYCETDGCLRRFLIGYFNEQKLEDCGNCGNCNGSFDETDVTIDAQKMLSHIARLNKAGTRLMFTHTSDIILGKSESFTNLPTYGIMKGSKRNYLRSLINKLKVLGYVHDDSYLSVTSKAGEVLSGKVNITIRTNKTDRTEKSKVENNNAISKIKYALSEELFVKLKELRQEIAKENQIPVFVVFSDATLVDMCQKHPRTEEEMLSVSGVGQVKLERYGDRFLQLLRTVEPNTAPEADFEEFSSNVFFRHFVITDSPIPISRVADNINAVFIRYGKGKTSGAKLNSLLVESGYLTVVDNEKQPSDKGQDIGITSVARHSERGDYLQCLFNGKAQRICAELLL